jgi:hypothetical protein
MPPALRRTFLSWAAHWRKIASNAAEAEDRRRKQNQETAESSAKTVSISSRSSKEADKG